MKTKIIHVAKAFTLTLPDGKIEFKPGRHEVEAEIADHWFVKPHLHPEGEEPSEVDPDLIQVAEQEIAALKADNKRQAEALEKANAVTADLAAKLGAAEKALAEAQERIRDLEAQGANGGTPNASEQQAKGKGKG